MSTFTLFPAFHSARRAFTLGVALLTTTAVASFARPARGDNLDAALLHHAPEIMHYLREHHCRNVGVLKFRVHRAGHPASFRVGPLDDNMIERLENALIAVNPVESPVGIIRNASHVAAQHRLAKYSTPAGQKALFGVKYPLAWGNAQVVPDLMLTGVVDVRPGLKAVTVRIEAFGPESPKQEQVVSFSVKTDRALLTDLGESFKISSRSLKRKTRDIELDDEAVADAGDESTASKPPTETPPAAGATTPSGMLYYEVRYDGQPQPVTPDPTNPKEFSVPEPSEGQTITFLVKSLASERIGLVLMINGKSTLYEEEGDPSNCKAWVLDPGRTYGIEGFQVDNATRKPFRVLSREESASVAYGPNTGTIQFHVLRQGSAGSRPPAGEEASKDAAASGSRNVSLRGLAHAHGAKARSLADLKKEVLAHAHATTRKRRGLIMAENNTIAGAIENDEVQNQVLVESVTVRYFRAAGQ